MLFYNSVKKLVTKTIKNSNKFASDNNNYVTVCNIKYNHYHTKHKKFVGLKRLKLGPKKFMLTVYDDEVLIHFERNFIKIIKFNLNDIFPHYDDPTGLVLFEGTELSTEDIFNMSLSYNITFTSDDINMLHTLLNNNKLYHNRIMSVYFGGWERLVTW